MKFRSLRAQVNFALTILVCSLLTQLFMARTFLTELSDNQSQLILTNESAILFYELERDVIDLQRNLLIFKETASESSVLRFHTVLENIYKKIEIFSENQSFKNTNQIDPDLFNRMVGHIQAYEENFTSVINARTKQVATLEKIEVGLNAIENTGIQNLRLEEKLTIRSSVVELKHAINNYQKFLDPEHSNYFHGEIENLRELLLKVNQKSMARSTLEIKTDFRRLIQINRGYLFLVNVVMAGSANEFLFLTKKMREQAIDSQNAIDRKTEISNKRIQNQNAIISLLSIVIIGSIGLFLSRRIISPIKNITEVFTSLAKGYDIDGIPNANRTDEIGDLAQAAGVFHENNRLTKKLLEESQDMIANQEVLNIQLEQEKRKAVEAAESKSMFLANMSHEIRTPMNGIVGLVDLVMKTDLNAKQTQYLERIAYSGQIMMNVINDILDFSKIEAGKMEIEHIEYDINQIIENVISSMSVRVAEKNLDFSVWVSPEVPMRLLGDPLRISQILLNLCSNSLKFTESGSVNINIDYLDTKLTFHVQDTGVGMSPGQLNSIFESFTQADGSISRKYGGTGLGLSIVKKLVSLMQGDIHVESEEGVGTQVHINIQSPCLGEEKALPELYGEQTFACVSTSDVNQLLRLVNDLKLGQSDVIAKQKTSQLDAYKYVIFDGLEALTYEQITDFSKKNKVMICILHASQSKELNKLNKIKNLNVLSHPFSPKQCYWFFTHALDLDGHYNLDQGKKQINKQLVLSGKVLLVEDNQINQLVAGDMLEELGLNFDVAEDGEQAIQKVQQSDYDLILMDVQMPVLDGYSATIKLRELGFNDVIICGLSANALKEDLDRAKASGMNDYLTKPLILEDLKSVLSKYLSAE